MALAHKPQVYAGLPSLHDAVGRFDAGTGQQVLENAIRSLFERNPHMAAKFGVGLLHRHFDMADDEILVEHGSTSVPWNMPSNPDDYMGGRILPRSWCFSPENNGLEPYEYEFRAHGEPGMPIDPLVHPDFVHELQDILDAHGLTSTLGLMSVPPDYITGAGIGSVFCEKTFGRANVVFNVRRETLKDKRNRTSIWVFGRSEGSGQDALLCLEGCVCRF
ncbi:hypothetical protein ANO11243_042010 [Dothideomycetidae sp. 11243]|nr:hypothetical protein ANO11243_042010 [fungal sp. No.11243]